MGLMRVMSPKEWRRNAPTIWSFPRIVGRYYSRGKLGFTAIPSCPSSLLRTWKPAVSKVVSIMIKSTMECSDGLDYSTVYSLSLLPTSACDSAALKCLIV